MQCNSCGTELPAKATHCPRCGAVTSYQISLAGVSPDAATSVSASSHPPLPPATPYDPYGMSSQNPDQVLNPYAPPPPPLPRQGRRFGLLAGMVTLLVILVIFASIGVATIARSFVSNTLPSQPSTPSGLTSQTSPTATLSPTATSALPYGNMPYAPFRGTLVLDDPLHDNSQGYRWPEMDADSYSCAFADGTYHSKTTPRYYNRCIAQNTDFTNFAYEAQMTILAGDCGALLFRVNNSMGNYYFFRVCQDGTYALFLDTGNQGPSLIKPASHGAIKTGLNQTNLLAVVANGPLLDLYVNQQHVDSISESTYSHGGIGVAASGVLGHSTEVMFSNVRVWKL